MPYEIRRFTDPGSFLIRAEPWLRAREIENNLVLGIAYSLAAGGDWYEPPLYLATVEREDSVVGVAFRTPPHKLGLTRMPLEAVPALVADVGKVYDRLRTVLGPIDVARAFAEEWTRLRGGTAVPGMAQRILALERVIPLRRPPTGGLRVARQGEAPLLADWVRAFHADTGIDGGDAEGVVNAFVGQERLFVWDDEGPRSMAAALGETPEGARIAYVYTPPRARGRGYASALTAALARALLDGGRRFVCLYTDRSAATPNRIYRRIGFQHVCDVGDVDLTDPATDPLAP